MAFTTKPYKGTRDFYPADKCIQDWMFEKLSDVVETYGYLSYDGPLIEPFELYAAKSGEEIVEKQLYWFKDRGERKVALRPEMTPTLARMVAGQLQELPKPIRWYSIPNFWRYERPQRGRLREFWQLNVDILGGDPVLADAETLQVAFNLIDSFGGSDKIQIEVNHRGLVNYVFNDKLDLTPELALKASKAIDAKDKTGQEAYEKALQEAGLNETQIQGIEDFFSTKVEDLSKKYPCQASEELHKLFTLLQPQPISSVLKFNPAVMRGLDYYTGTVFEVYDVSPENNRAMFGGGRYDNLIGLFGKNTLSGVGFGMGDVTLRNFLETHSLLPESVKPSMDIFIACDSEAAIKYSLPIAEQIRNQLGLKVHHSLSQSKFGSQLKSANKLNSRVALLIGGQEVEEDNLTLKILETGAQETFPKNKLLESLTAIFR